MPSDLLVGSPIPAFCADVFEPAAAQVVIELRRVPL